MNLKLEFPPGDGGEARLEKRIGAREDIRSALDIAAGGRGQSGRPALGGGSFAGAGFTLIEIMVAIGIFMMVMVSIYSTWTAVLRASKVGLNAAAEAQRTRMAWQSIQESLGALQFFSANVPYYAFYADTSRSYAAMSFVAYLPASFPGSGMFRGLPVRRVTFEVETGGGGAQLVMKQTPLLEPANPTVPPYKIVLVPDISQFQLEFWDPQSTDWIPEWYSTNQPPRLVRVNLGIGDARQGTPRVATRVIDVHAMPIPPAFQIPQVPMIGGVVGGGVGAGVRPGIGTPAPRGNASMNSGSGMPGDRQLYNPFPDFQLPTPPSGSKVKR